MKGGLPYFLTAGLAVAGAFVFFVYFLVTGITGLDDQLIPLEAPGEEMLSLEEGVHTVFHEPSYERQKAEGLKLTVEGPAEVRVSATKGSSYTVMDRQGFSVLSFTIEQPGDYRLITEVEGEESLYLTLGHNFMGGILNLVLECMGILSACGLFALVFLVLGIRASREVKSPSPGLLATGQRRETGHRLS